jgi:hypothetical protein
MPAVATLEELKAVETELNAISAAHPEAYQMVAELFKKNRKVGYKNICKILLGEATPEKLKGLA